MIVMLVWLACNHLIGAFSNKKCTEKTIRIRQEYFAPSVMKACQKRKNSCNNPIYACYKPILKGVIRVTVKLFFVSNVVRFVSNCYLIGFDNRFYYKVFTNCKTFGTLKWILMQTLSVASAPSAPCACSLYFWLFFAFHDQTFYSLLDK